MAIKDRDPALATLRVEQLERQSLQALNRYLAGATKWTGTICFKYDRWSRDEVLVPVYAEPLHMMGVLLDNTAEWRPVETIKSREINVQHMDHEDV